MRSVDILLVEDNPVDAELVSRGFARSEPRMAYQLHVVGDAETAIDFLRRRGAYADSPRPDLVLLDLNLPGEGGWAVLREVASDAGLRAIPVIVMSGSSDDRHVLESYLLYANSYVVKPMDAQQFQSAMAILKKFWLGSVRLPRKIATLE